MSAKPGNYNVYDVKGEDGFDTILLFVHEDEPQDIKTSLGVRQFRDDSDCTLRCEVSILDSGKQCKNDFIVLSNFQATIGIASPINRC